MTLNKGGNGFQARSHPSERRADFDLMRRISQLERLDDGGSGGGSLPPDGDPGEVLTIDSGGAPTWAPGGIVQTVVAGENVEVDSTDPANPIVSTTPLMTIDGILRNWNSAWGVLALYVGTATAGVPIAGGATATLQGWVTFTPRADRRYRIVYYIRAFGGVPALMSCVLRVDGTANATFSDPWIRAEGNWASVPLMFVGTGDKFLADGNAHTYTIQVTSQSANVFQYWPDMGSPFYVEDLGPVSPTLPAPPPVETTAWATLPLNANWFPQSSQHIPQYRKVGDEVQVRGSLVWQTPLGANPISTFPTGFRPGRREYNSTAMFMDVLGVPTSPGNGVWGPRLTVSGTTGNLDVIGLNASIGGYLSLDSIRFSVTP